MLHRGDRILRVTTLNVAVCANTRVQFCSHQTRQHLPTCLLSFQLALFGKPQMRFHIPHCSFIKTRFVECPGYRCLVDLSSSFRVIFGFLVVSLTNALFNQSQTFGRWPPLYRAVFVRYYFHILITDLMELFQRFVLCTGGLHLTDDGTFEGNSLPQNSFSFTS